MILNETMFDSRGGIARVAFHFLMTLEDKKNREDHCRKLEKRLRGMATESDLQKKLFAELVLYCYDSGKSIADGMEHLRKVWAKRSKDARPSNLRHYQSIRFCKPVNPFIESLAKSLDLTLAVEEEEQVPVELVQDHVFRQSDQEPTAPSAEDVCLSGVLEPLGAVTQELIYKPQMRARHLKAVQAAQILNSHLFDVVNKSAGFPEALVRPENARAFKQALPLLCKQTLESLPDSVKEKLGPRSLFQLSQVCDLAFEGEMTKTMDKMMKDGSLLGLLARL